MEECGIETPSGLGIKIRTESVELRIPSGTCTLKRTELPSTGFPSEFPLATLLRSNVHCSLPASPRLHDQDDDAREKHQESHPGEDVQGFSNEKDAEQ